MYHKEIGEPCLEPPDAPEYQCHIYDAPLSALRRHVEGMPEEREMLLRALTFATVRYVYLTAEEAADTPEAFEV